MKAKVLSLMFLCVCALAQGQFLSSMVVDGKSGNSDFEVFFGVVNDNSILNEYNLAGEKNVPKDPYDNLLQYNSGDRKSIYRFSRIAIRVFNNTEKKLAKIGDSGLSKVILKIGLNTCEFELSEIDKKITDYYINILDLINEKEPNGSLRYAFSNDLNVSIDLKFESDQNKKILVQPFKGTYFSPFETYKSLNSNTRGFWIPSLLFSSNLKSDSTGVPFASMPFGIAYGWKKNTNSNIYYGASIVGSWLIHSENEVQNRIPTSNKWSLSNVALGILFDINDVFYIGYSYGWDLRANTPDPGNMIVIGFGIKSMNFLKNNK